MKVRIKKLGKLKSAAYGGQQPDGALDVTPSAFGGSDMYSANEGMQVQKTLTSEPREEANLEAEGGETAFGPISGDTIPDHMVIKGPRHTNGGVPLNLPDDTFIFSDTKKMRINDPAILAMFGKKKKKGGYTPADLAKPYDIQKYKAILMDPKSDEKTVATAQMMIQNYVLKLGALALAQEAKKGFPQGIPEMARPYMEENKISEEDILPQEEEPAPEEPMMDPQQMMAMQQPQQPMMPPQPGMMAFGGYSNLNKFVDGGEDDDLVVLGNQDGLVQNDLPTSSWADAFQNNNAPDNPYARVDDISQIEVDSQAPITNKQVEEGTVESPEKLIPTPEEMASGEGGKASYKYKNTFELNKPEIARRANMALQIGANLVNEYDRRRIQGDDQRSSYDRDSEARRKDSRGMYGANTGREALRAQEEAEMIVGQDYGQYGGSMEDYAMSMGGAYFPAMEYGGFNKLQKFAGPDNSQVGDNGKSSSRKKTKDELQQGIKDGAIQDVTEIPDDAIEVGVDDDGNTIYARGNILIKSDKKPKLEVRKPSKSKGKVDEDKYVKDMCQSMKTGSYVGRTAQELADARIISQDAVSLLQPCETLEKVESTLDDDEYFRAAVEEQICECVDEEGNVLPAEDQPEPDENGKCPCVTYSEVEEKDSSVVEEEEAYVDDPHWSDVGTRAVYTAAAMNPGVDRPQLALPDKVETRPVYEDYLAKVQAIQAGATGAIDSINKTAGSTGDKMAMISQVIGQTSPAAGAEVAGVQARNIGYQDAANARKFQGDQNYVNAVADVKGRQAMIDADVANTYRTNQNVKAANVQEQIAQVEGEMTKRQNMNQLYPQYASEYHKGFIYPTGRGRTPVPEKTTGMDDYAAMYAKARGAFQDDELARKYVESQMGLSRYGGEAYKKGGYVMGTTMFPFMFY